MPMSNDAQTGVETWQPSVTLDVMTASQKAFNDTYTAFYSRNQGRVCRPDLLSTGWHIITPQIAEELLLGKANRKLSIATIAYYARLMMAGAWKRTGETLIISEDGILRDAYHRAWAAFLSGQSFDSFVVTGIGIDAETLLNINNGKPRGDADGLEFAGLNGLSKLIASMVKIAIRYDDGYYEPRSHVKISKMSPLEVTAYVQARPSLHDAAHGIIAEFKAVLTALLPGKADVVCFVGWRIYDLFGVDIMEEFFTEVSDEAATGPFALLRAKLEAEVDHQRRGYRPGLDKRDVFAFLIKTFNAWRLQSAPRRLVLGTDEAFPQFVTPTAETGQAPGHDAEDADEDIGFGGAPEGVAVHTVPGQADPVPA